MCIRDRPQVVYEKDTKKAVSGDVKQWDGNLSFMELLLESIISAIKAIIPLCLFLFVVLRFLLREKIPQADEISIGILFAIIGLSIFGIGIYLGSVSYTHLYRPTDINLSLIAYESHRIFIARIDVFYNAAIGIAHFQSPDRTCRGNRRRRYYVFWTSAIEF